MLAAAGADAGGGGGGRAGAPQPRLPTHRSCRRKRTCGSKKRAAPVPSGGCQWRRRGLGALEQLWAAVTEPNFCSGWRWSEERGHRVSLRLLLVHALLGAGAVAKMSVAGRTNNARPGDARRWRPDPSRASQRSGGRPRRARRGQLVVPPPGKSRSRPRALWQSTCAATGHESWSLRRHCPANTAAGKNGTWRRPLDITCAAIHRATAAAAAASAGPGRGQPPGRQARLLGAAGCCWVLLPLGQEMNILKTSRALPPISVNVKSEDSPVTAAAGTGACVGAVRLEKGGWVAGWHLRVLPKLRHPMHPQNTPREGHRRGSRRAGGAQEAGQLAAPTICPGPTVQRPQHPHVSSTHLPPGSRHPAQQAPARPAARRSTGCLRNKPGGGGGGGGGG